MTQREQDAPRNDEVQSTAWLAWLARGMQRHNQTIFLIEQLQPSWLSTRVQSWFYIVTTRLIWSVFVGLIVGLVDGLVGGLSKELVDGLIVGLLAGLVVGLIVGLFDILRLGRNRSRSVEYGSGIPRWIIGGGVAFGLMYGTVEGLIYGSIWGVIYGLVYRPIDGLIVALLIGLVGMPIWEFRRFQLNPLNEIQNVETVRFSWAYVPRGLMIGGMGGLVLGLGSGLIYGPTDGLKIGLVVGLIIGLVSCFRLRVRELKTIPNQGIWLSLRSGSVMGGVGGLGIGLIVGVAEGWTTGLVYGALAGLCIGLWYGGIDVIAHYLLRLLLWRAGAMPRDYARFLDYAAEKLNFLQKVGDGYIFLHRYLLEYFAALEPAGPAVDFKGRNRPSRRLPP